VNVDGEDQIVLDVIRSEVMRLALVRLNGFPAEEIAKALRTGLGGEDLMHLIHLLRKELLFGRQLHSEVGIGIGIEDIGIVADLLIVALDTIGIGGLVLGNSSDEFIQELRGEVAAVVEGVREAAALKSILEEVLRHADWRRATIEKKQAGRKRAKKRKGNSEGIKTNARGSENREAELRNEIGKTAVERTREMPAKSVSVARHLVNSGPVINADTSVLSPLLPLGVPPAPVSRISLVTAQPAENGINFKELRQLNRTKIKEASYRESMVAGVYSVESMLV